MCALMENNEINIDKLTKYWMDGSDDDFETMIAMYKPERYS